MGIPLDAIEPVEPGVYDATITKVESKDGQFGARLQIALELPDGRTVNGFFPTVATQNNKLGQLFIAVFGELRKADSDDLIGARVKVLVEDKTSNGNTYSNVTKVYPRQYRVKSNAKSPDVSGDLAEEVPF